MVFRGSGFRAYGFRAQGSGPLLVALPNSHKLGVVEA